MKILVIHGPNLNMLGKRDALQYGTKTLADIEELLKTVASKANVELVFFQSNHEGNIIDFLQTDASRRCDGILINPGALTHYGYSLRDALTDTALPIVEVHLSDISSREDFRKIDVLEGIVKKCISGLREQSYVVGLKALLKEISL